MHAALPCCSRIALPCLLVSATAAFGGNMSVVVGTLPAVQLTGFSTGATNPSSTSGSGGGGAGKVSFQDFHFTAPQSAASPDLMRWVSNGQHVQRATVQVRSTDGTRLLSEWVLSDVLVRGVGIVNGGADPKAKDPDIYLAPEMTFSLAFSKYCYTLFAADGRTVASQMCWDLAANRE